MCSFSELLLMFSFLSFQPSNMLMLGSMLKLIDYGSARRIVSKGGEVGEMVGTAEFMCKLFLLPTCFILHLIESTQ